MALSLLRNCNNIKSNLSSGLSKLSQQLLRSSPSLVIRSTNLSHVCLKSPESVALKTLKNPNLRISALTSQSARSSSSTADHRKLWLYEKILSAALVVIVPVTIAFPSPILDNLFAVSVVIHQHWGLEACAADYIRPIIFGNVIPGIAVTAVYVLSAITLGGLLYYNYTDIGIGNTVRKFWAIKE